MEYKPKNKNIKIKIKKKKLKQKPYSSKNVFLFFHLDSISSFLSLSFFLVKKKKEYRKDKNHLSIFYK